MSNLVVDPELEMKRELRGLHLAYIHDGNESAIRVRGGETFTHWALTSAARSVLMGYSFAALPTTRLRVLLTASPWPATADFVEKFAEHDDVRVVLDVTAPVLRPEMIIGDVARELWSTTDAQSAIKRQFAAATAVITPHATWSDAPGYPWVDDVRQYTRAPIRVVSNVVDDVSRNFFTGALSEAFTSSADIFQRRR